jgi:hypothetical protein
MAPVPADDASIGIGDPAFGGVGLLREHADRPAREVGRPGGFERGGRPRDVLRPLCFEDAERRGMPAIALIGRPP